MKKIITLFMILFGLGFSFVIFTSQSVLAVEYSFATIDYPNASNTWVYGINDAGDIVGHYYDVNWSPGWVPGSGQHAFSLINGSFSTIDYPGASMSVANGINDTGQIAGYYWNGSNYVSYLLESGSFSTIGYPSGADRIFAGDINDSGKIVGSYGPGNHGFSLTGSSLSTIDFPTAIGTGAYGINDAGQIVGDYSDASGGQHGFLLIGDSFSTIDYPGASITFLDGINDTSQIVGYYQDSSSHYYSFLYDGDSFSTINVPWATKTIVTGINDSGQIVGWYTDANGQHGFVGTVVPEPISSILFLTGGAVLGARNFLRRKKSGCPD